MITSDPYDFLKHYCKLGTLTKLDSDNVSINLDAPLPPPPQSLFLTNRFF